jgi:hypothetical protein
MQFKHFLNIIMIILILLSNYFINLEYYNEYDPDNFDIKKLMHLRYRCIRHFYDKSDNKYMSIRCNPYLHDYTGFILEKSRYVYAYYAHNLCMISLFIIFNLLL